MARAANTDRAWAKEELNKKKKAHIRWLETEIDHLRRVNRKIEIERDEAMRTYTYLAKQNAYCLRCLQHLDSNDRHSPIVPIGTETRQDTETPLVENTRDPYRDSFLPRGDLSSATSAATHPAAIQGPNVLTASVPTDSASDSNDPSLFTGLSPILTSSDTLPSSVSNSRSLSPARTSRHASSIPSGLTEDSWHGRRAGSPALRGQAALSEQDPCHEGPLAQSHPARGGNEDAFGELSEGNLLAETSSRHRRVDHGRRSSSRASSEVPIQSASRSREEREIAAELRSDEHASADSLDSSSAETDEDSADDSDMELAPSVDTSEYARQDTDYDDVGREGSTSHNNKKSFDQVAPTLHPRKGPAGRLVHSPQTSNDAHPAARDAGSPKALSTSAYDVSSASRSLNPKAPHNPTTLGSRSSATPGSSTQLLLNRADAVMSAPAPAGRSACISGRGRNRCRPEDCDSRKL